MAMAVRPMERRRLISMGKGYADLIRTERYGGRIESFWLLLKAT